MNKRKILRVLRKVKSLAYGTLASEHKIPERCVVGELLHAEGISDKELRGRGYSEFGVVLRNAYQLATTDINHIVGFNDGASYSDFAEKCKFKTKGKGAQVRRNKARACVVIKEIQRM